MAVEKLLSHSRMDGVMDISTIIPAATVWFDVTKQYHVANTNPRNKKMWQIQMLTGWYM
jgi:hypothetical protein